MSLHPSRFVFRLAETIKQLRTKTSSSHRRLWHRCHKVDGSHPSSPTWDWRVGTLTHAYRGAVNLRAQYTRIRPLKTRQLNRYMTLPNLR